MPFLAGTFGLWVPLHMVRTCMTTVMKKARVALQKAIELLIVESRVWKKLPRFLI